MCIRDRVDAEENGKTFRENAIIKAKAVAYRSGMPAISDDSGLEVDALNGRPGVYTARYASEHGERPTDDENIDKLLRELQGVEKAVSYTHLPTAEQVAALCEEFLPKDPRRGKSYEIAFFGGSFTAIERRYMLSLLQAAYPFVKAGRAAGIRCSTRPDAISPEILDILKAYGVTSIELGAQAMDDVVLEKNLRGHTVADVYARSRLIKAVSYTHLLHTKPPQTTEKRRLPL